MAKLGLSVRVDVVNKADDVRVEVHRDAPEVIDEPKPKYLDPQEVEKLVNARQAGRQVMLKGKLFGYVRAAPAHEAAYRSDGKLYTPFKLVHMSEGWTGGEPDDLPQEYWPEVESDVERPSDWIDSIETLHNLGWEMKCFFNCMRAFFRAHPKAEEPKLMIWNNKVVPLLKIFEDLSWIDLGWEGPVIVVLEGVGDCRVAQTKGIIPDSSEFTTAKELYDRLHGFAIGKLQEFPDTYPDKAQFIADLSEFTTFLDQQSITYK